MSANDRGITQCKLWNSVYFLA